jgi:hypothetical protein
LSGEINSGCISHMYVTSTLRQAYDYFQQLYQNWFMKNKRVYVLQMWKGEAIPVTGLGGPGGYETLRLPHFLDNRLTDGGKVVSLTHRPPFTPPPPGRFLVLISVRAWVEPRAIVRLEILGQLKNPMTSLRLEPATFQLVAQCLNQLRYRVPLCFKVLNFEINRSYILSIQHFRCDLHSAKYEAI